MKLFWKIFISMFISFVVIVSSISYIISVKQISDVEKRIIEEKKIIGSFLSKEIEVGYFESKWPFESLKKLSKHQGVLFWWIVRDDGTIHLADNASFMGTYAQDYFPQIASINEKENISLNRDQNYGIFFTPLETGKKRWSFWFGFSLKEVSERRQEIIFLIAVVSLSALIMLGVILYFAIKHFTKPIQELTVGAETIGKGDLTLRVKIRSKDELGQLANSFNKMTEDLQKTTVSKDYVDNIIESMRDVLVVVDSEKKIRTVNKATYEFLGYQEEEIIGKPLEIIFAEVGGLPEGKKLEKLIEEGEVKNFETSFRTKDSRNIPALFSSSVMKDKDGKMICLVCTGRDITERKRTEEALLNAAQQWRTTFDGISDIVCLLDAEGRILRCNKAMVNLIGKPFSEIIGRPHWEIIHGTTGPIKESPFERLRETHRKETAILPIGDRWFSIAVDPLLNEAGSLIGAVHIMSDITERKRAEEAFKRSEEEAKRLSQENAIMAEIGRIISSTLNIEEVYERFAEEVHKLIPFDRIGIQTVNPKDNTTTVAYISGVDVESRRVRDIVPIEGTATGECIRLRSSFLFQTESIDEVVNRFPGLLSTFKAGLRSMILVPLFSKDQVIGVLHIRSLKPNAYTESDLRLAERVGSQIAGAIANAQLFIERKRAEEERTALQEQLRQSQKMEAVGQLAGGIAHDFNNLLTVITGYSDMILKQLNQNDSMRGNAEEIQRAAEKAASLTRQLLAFSRKQMLQSKVFDLRNLVTNMKKMLQRLIGEHIDMITLSAKDLARIKADPGQIEQVLLNLVVNAKDAMPSGGKLTIEMANVELDENYARSHISLKPGGYVMLSVSDTGCGMPPEIRERIFDPFFTTKEKGKGTGLGLSTVYGIVKQSEGSIYVYSEPGRGTTFKIYFPRIEEVIESIKPDAEITKSFQGSETILLVEDEEMVRRLASTILQDNGYKVLEASNGEKALRIVQEHGAKQIHLMVTDVVMPGMSGQELADCLESMRPEMKVIYISGYTDNAIIHQGVLKQGIAFIEKPFTPDALVRKVRDVLDESKQEQQSFSEIPKDGVMPRDELQTSGKHGRNFGRTDRRLLS